MFIARETSFDLGLTVDVQVNERARPDVMMSDGHCAAESEAALRELAALSQGTDLG